LPVTVGLDIGGTGVRAAVVDISRSGRTLKTFAELPLPRGTVEGGDVVDESGLAEVLSSLWKQTKIPRKRIVLGIASRRAIVRQVDVPQLEDDELVESLAFHVEDALPMSVHDAVLDFVPQETFLSPEREPMRSILVIAVARDIIDSFLRVAEEAELSLGAIDLQAFGLVRSVFGLAPALGNPRQVLVDVGASVTQIVVAQGGVASFVRLLPRGGNDFTKALMNELNIESADAEELKRRIGIAASPAPGPGGADDGDALRVLSKEGTAFIEEVRDSVQFSIGQSGGPPIERLVVAGNGARLPHLASRMGEQLRLPVAPAKVLDFVDVGEVGRTEDELLAAQPVLPTAVGLSLWGNL
jgi:type IV pilus assembly protein PilM